LFHDLPVARDEEKTDRRGRIMGDRAARWRASAVLGDDLQYFAYHELCPFDGIIGVIL